jgi:hypothetical protein
MLGVGHVELGRGTTTLDITCYDPVRAFIIINHHRCKKYNSKTRDSTPSAGQLIVSCFKKYDTKI